MPTTLIRRAAGATSTAALALAAGLALAPAAHAAEVYALGSLGNTLVRFDHGNPGGASAVGSGQTCNPSAPVAAADRQGPGRSAG